MVEQYPVLSDVKKEAFKAYGIGRGVFGLLPVARVTFVIDKKGVVRCVTCPTSMKRYSHIPFVRDALDATLNFGAHSKFVEKWLVKLEAEEKAVPVPTPTAPAATEAMATTTAEVPAAA